MTPERLLEILLRPVPGHRAAWKDAIRAELAGLDDPRERWAFALSCWRLPLRALAAPRAAGLLVLTGLAAAKVFDAWVKRDGSGTGRVALMVTAGLLVWYLALLLAGTARRSPLARRTLAAGGVAALAATGIWLALTLLSPVGTGWHLPLATAAIAALAAALCAGPPARQRAAAALWAAGGVALLLPPVAFVTLDLSGLWGRAGVPDYGLGASWIEARDAYEGLLLVAVVAAAALTLLTGLTGRSRKTLSQDSRKGAP
ncbi:hypothetical protein [Dactylosporangium sp. NPDC048998]|uniref:hypothetical protein n=1 Tax=Dactylosporangium sp. NPDC048998 TaxID=3363976 RepID=UPI00371AFFD6